LICVKTATAALSDRITQTYWQLSVAIMLPVIQGFFDKVSNRLRVMRRAQEFTCGDCERVERCGLPPRKDCTARLEQMERGTYRFALRRRRIFY
jgi:hypothetical protein